MIGADDILDDAHWTNVQDPIRKMFLSLTKAIRAQSAGIRDLDRKYAELITTENAERLVRDNVNSCCSKQDATQLIYQIDTKASSKDVAVLESRLEQAHRSIDLLTTKLQDQSLVINDLTNKLDTVSLDVHSLKNPNYEQIFGYIDRQVGNLATDVDRKLAVKADHNEVNTCIPQRLEDLYRSMNVKINEMKVDLARCATKEEFHILANNKADGVEIKELAHELKELVTHHELHQQVNSQIQPLVTAMSSLEKAIQIQDISTKHTQTTFTDKMQTLERLYREYIDHKASNEEQVRAALNKDKLTSAVEEIMHLHRWGEVTPSTLENAVQQQTEYMLSKMGIMGESIRMEVVTSTREEFNSIQHAMDMKISDVTRLAKEISEKHMKTRKAVKELSLNVATALSKKVDLKDYKSHLQHQQQQGGHVSTSSLSSGAAAGGGARGGNSGYQSVVNQSRSLLNTSQDNNMLSSAAESDPNREFDYLLQSMRSETNRSNYHNHNTTGSNGRGHRYSSSGNELSGDDQEGEEVDSLEERKDPHHSRSLNQSRVSRSSATSGGVGGGSRLRGHSSSPLRRSRAHFHPDELRSTFGSGHPGTSNRSTSASKRGKLPSAEVEAVEALQRTVYSLAKEVEQLKSAFQQHLATNRSCSSPSGFNATQAVAQDLDKLDWRLALGEISMNLRREVADKASREELFSVLRTEIEAVDRKISAVQKGVDAAAASTDLVKLESDFTVLRNRVAGELTGARFLWTSGQVMTDGWLPWDVQVINVAPSIIAWKKNTTGITVKVPGLYHINISVFTTLPTILQVYLNDEPLFSFQPDSMDGSSGQNANPNIQKSEKYTLRRLRHSAGEVSSISINEHVSLPAEANLMVRYHAGAPAQAFFAIKKL